MRRRVIWTESARDDLQGIRAYFGQFNPSAAQHLAVRLKLAADGLADHPERGRPLKGDRRELLVIWPYIIGYRIRGEVVEIIRVRHGGMQSG